MARIRNRLTAITVDKLKEAGRHADGDGLYLSISANGGRRWVFLYRWRGKLTEMGLGSARDVGLAKARIAASEARALITKGISPLEAKRDHAAIANAAPVPATPTFKMVCDDYIASHEASWKNEKHRAQWRSTMESYAKPLHLKPVDQIETEAILAVLKPVWQLKPETALRVRGRIEQVLDAAAALGYRNAMNPARWKGHLDKLLPRPKKLIRGHHKAMPFGDVASFLAVLRTVESISARALEFAILTAARSGEVLGARWDEVDFTARVWTIPGSRMKSGRIHRVPLSDRALLILKSVETVRASAFVFPGGKANAGLSNMALTMALRRAKGDDFTPHGFRSSFRDWAGECTAFPREIAEAALAHVVGDDTERAYRRGDALERRRVLMAAWDRYCAGDIAGNLVVVERKAL